MMLAKIVHFIHFIHLLVKPFNINGIYLTKLSVQGVQSVQENQQ